MCGPLLSGAQRFALRRSLKAVAPSAARQGFSHAALGGSAVGGPRLAPTPWLRGRLLGPTVQWLYVSLTDMPLGARNRSAPSHLLGTRDSRQRRSSETCRRVGLKYFPTALSKKGGSAARRRRQEDSSWAAPSQHQSSSSLLLLLLSLLLLLPEDRKGCGGRRRVDSKPAHITHGILPCRAASGVAIQRLPGVLLSAGLWTRSNPSVPPPLPTRLRTCPLHTLQRATPTSRGTPAPPACVATLPRPPQRGHSTTPPPAPHTGQKREVCPGPCN